MTATRDALSKELEKVDTRTVVVDADVSSSCKSRKYSELHPDKSFNLGIAEQNVAAVAAGLASCGKKAVVCAYAVFASMRMCEVIRQMIAYPNLDVKIVATHCGLTPAADGATHQAIEDIGIMRSIPNIRILQPADYNSARVLIRKAFASTDPFYIRLTRNSIPTIYPEDIDLELGKPNYVLKNPDSRCCIVGSGDTVHLALKAHDILQEQQIQTDVVDWHSFKVNPQFVNTDYDYVVTIEDHNVINGLGTDVSNVFRICDSKAKIDFIGIEDHYGESAPYERLMAKNGITAENVVEKVTRWHHENSNRL